MAAPAFQSSGELLLARRPGNGTVGNPVQLLSNNFFVRFDPSKTICHYDVTVSPEVNNKGLRREIISVMMKQHLGRMLPVYDGDKSLYTAQPVDKMEMTVVLDEKREDGGRRRDRNFQVTLIDVARINLGELDGFLKGRSFVLPQKTLQVLEVVLRQCAADAKELIPGGRSYFGRVIGYKDLGGGVEAWKGFYMSLRPIRNGYLALTVDTTGNAFVSRQSLLCFVSNYLGTDVKNIERDIQRQDAGSDAWRMKMKRLLKNMKVETNHSGKRVYKVSDLTRLPLYDLKFDLKGKETTVLDYFNDIYQKKILFPCLPALVCGVKKNYIPMELCTIVEGQNWTRRVNESQRNQLSSMTCCKPAERKEATLTALKKLKDQSAKYTTQFGIQINSLLSTVNARELPTPRIRFLNGDVDARNGSWNMLGKRVVEGREVKSWGIICCSRSLRPQELMRIAEELAESARSYGMGMRRDMAFEPKHIADPRALEKVLQATVKEVRESGNPQLELVLCIMPSADNKAHYCAVKRACDLQLGIVSQCCKDVQIRRCDKRYLANLVLKINGKFGGKNFLLSENDSRQFKTILHSPTLVIGADVSHSRGADFHDESQTSMAAVVASMDWPGFAQYQTVVRNQPLRQEIVEDLYWEKVDEQGHKQTGGIFKEILTAFHHRTNMVPHRVIYYRDGVSEGQFEAVLRFEFEQLKRAFEALGWTDSKQMQPSEKRPRMDGGPKVTFIIVQKKHRVVFFPSDKQRSQDKDNIRPGTIVDKDVCHPQNFDYFLCSHQGIKGTSRPVHYHVLKDENEFTADEIQMFTYGMCHLYSRCTRSVSVVPPVYYAHLAAKRAQTWLDPESSSQVAGSVASGGTVGGGGSTGSGKGRRGNRPVPPVTPLPPIHDNIKDTMFYL